MRICLRRQPFVEGADTLWNIAKLLSTSGLAVHVWALDSGLQALEFCVSNVTEKEAGKLSTRWVHAKIKKKWKRDEILDVIKQTLGGRWFPTKSYACLAQKFAGQSIENESIKQRVFMTETDYEQALSGFLDAGQATRICQNVATALESQGLTKSAPKICEGEIFELPFDRSPYKPLVAALELSPLYLTFHWIRHLRAAGVAEYQIAHQCLELFQRTAVASYASPRATLQETIKVVSEVLSRPSDFQYKSGPTLGARNALIKKIVARDCATAPDAAQVRQIHLLWEHMREVGIVQSHERQCCTIS